MKMLFLVTDSEYEPHCMTTMKEKGVTGYTVIPDVFGAGRSGLKMGDRVHPGASVVVLAVVPDEAARGLMECIRDVHSGEQAVRIHPRLGPARGGEPLVRRPGARVLDGRRAWAHPMPSLQEGQG